MLLPEDHISREVFLPEEVRVWEIIEGERLREVNRAPLDLEARIEGWLEKDVSTVSDDLLIVGRQVRTDRGGVIDLLCLDSAGDVTILELKRDMTPREVTSQLLEYAAWASDLTATRIVSIANEYLGDNGPLEDAFALKFRENLPDNLNTSDVSMLLVAAEVDERSERIISFLSDAYGVPINVVTFNYFRSKVGTELLTRVFLIEPEQVEHRTQTKSSSKRTPPPSIDKLVDRAERKGYGQQFTAILSTAQKHNLSIRRFANSLMYGPRTHRNRALFTVSVGSTIGEGVTVKVSHEAWSDFYPVEEGEVRSALGRSAGPMQLTSDEAHKFVEGLNNLFSVIEGRSGKASALITNE